MRRFHVASLLALSLIACLRRPVSEEEPSTKIFLETVVAQPAIDKIDLLVMVDNSSSMADKQRILADALPDLVKGLVQPKCVDIATRAPTTTLSDPTQPEGQMCPAGLEPAFPPITDMHVGVLSSSLGGMGSASCPANEDGRINDDHGHLISRNKKVQNDLNFLAWYPDVEKNRDKRRHPEPPVAKTTDLNDLTSSFQDLVVGVGQNGCGLEAQLESVYHFLVQPDPWLTIEKDEKDRAVYGPGTDAQLLRQRAAFLRPDSLVAVIVLSDEDDSVSDPLSFGGLGWQFMSKGPLARGTPECDEDPTSSACKSCATTGTCATPFYTEKEDSLNVRFHDMKRRFGVDPRFPIQRYVDAFTNPKAPLRAKEHDATGTYAPQLECTNPLFAKKLPTSEGEDLCHLARGPRSDSLVYFAVIGGVPNNLVATADRIDWTRVLGRDPEGGDDTGIDAHMIQSTKPRVGLPPPGSADGSDPTHGREWTTGGDDLQYACTFDLYERNGDTAQPTEESCAETGCDCDGARDMPLCKTSNRTKQVKGKAYPSRRPLALAKRLGDRGIAQSLCPQQLDQPLADNYGYKPAVRTITNRLEASLDASCLPRALVRDDTNQVPCLVLAVLPDPGSDQTECARANLKPLRESLRNQFKKRENEDPTLPVCEIPQVTDCKNADEIGFCYVEGGQCTHALTFTKASQDLAGARFIMQCIERPSTAN